MKKLILFAAFALMLGAAVYYLAQERDERNARQGFIQRRGARFVIDGRPFRFVGANIAVMYKEEDRARMPETLRQAALDGVRVVRVWAFGEGGENSTVKSIGGDRHDWPRLHPFRFAPGEWNEEAFIHLDRVIAEAARNNIYVQLCLTNWWRDTGGVTQYLHWAGIKDAADDRAPYGINVERAMLFYTNEETRRLYREHVERIVTRRNSVTGVLYRDDPTILGYELMNEAQAPTGRWAERRAWVAEMSAYIKSLDPGHLVAPGTWGYRTSWERREWLEEHRIQTIDYCDVHNYPRDDLDSYVDSPEALRNFIENRAAAAFSINKPLVFGEFGMGPEGYQGFSQAEWFRAYFEGVARSGVSGAMYWIFTPDPQRGYGVTYTVSRDEPIRTEIRRAAELFTSLQNENPPPRLLDFSRHLVPHQFAFARPENDPATRPDMSVQSDGTILYLFKPEMAASARFEKLGYGPGYIWGAGVGHVEYVLPARDHWRRVASLVVRAHLQPVLPGDARPPITASRVTLLINGTDCGSRLIPIEDPKQARTQEWQVDSYSVRLQAARGKTLSIRFAVQVDADLPYGLNISNYPEGYSDHEIKPIQVEVR
ncbi:MAG TPA: cellulase family glycosylhydrolase [Pyrinomonadaceae bacterium]|nr:cellulase family glycosylhydrolase [Pyrinomonadaceae bacterium]